MLKKLSTPMKVAASTGLFGVGMMGGMVLRPAPALVDEADEQKLRDLTQRVEVQGLARRAFPRTASCAHWFAPALSASTAQAMAAWYARAYNATASAVDRRRRRARC
jgi:hypothetical protein